MPIKNMWFNFKLECIGVFLQRAFEVNDEYVKTFLQGLGDDPDCNEEADYEHAGDILLGYQEIVVRAALGELNALVELELTNIAETIVRERPEVWKRKARIDRGAARSLIEEYYGLRLQDLPGYARVDELRKVVNAYKHEDGLRPPSEVPLLTDYFDGRYRLDPDEAVQYLEAVRGFLLFLPGERTAIRVRTLRKP
jgi:hypothetical protein